MIHRINMPDMKDLQFNLLHTLGIIYRDRQKNFDSAAEAFRMASGLNPDARHHPRHPGRALHGHGRQERGGHRRAPVAAQA
jgi:uncharacterized protein HemY